MSVPSLLQLATRRLGACAVLVLAAVLGGCATDPATLERIWQGTYVYMPSRPDAPQLMRYTDAQALARDAGEGARLPAVIFLHGCAGFTVRYYEAAYPEALARAGYAVFVPDSFARGPQRQRACGNVKADTVSLRHVETDSTLQRVLALPWVDRRNLFLAGHSEGGIATAMYTGHDFVAYFIAGWSCVSINPSFDRIHAPRQRPVLAVLGDRDEYYQAHNVGHCGQRMFGRPSSRSVILKDRDHDGVSRDPEAARLLVEFFDQHRLR